MLGLWLGVGVMVRCWGSWLGVGVRVRCWSYG